MPGPLALFLLGGAANGKSSAVRALFRTEENGDDHDLPDLESDRWCGPDREKASIGMFTDAPADLVAVKNFGADAEMDPKLGGASGPLNRTQFERYPRDVQEQAEQLVRTLGIANVFEFANGWLAKQNRDRRGDNFGAGLTHELSKALAYAKLMRCLDERDPYRPFVWDAIGNPDNYITWIERARDRGYAIRIIYVRSPLPVAQLWATRRARSIAPSLVYDSFLQASNAAIEIAAFADAEGLDFEVFYSSEPEHLVEALLLRHSDVKPAPESDQ